MNKKTKTTKWSTVGKRRLLKLADHLERGTLGHKKFHFPVINIGVKDRKGCGSHGCAIGENPIVFPRQWRFSSYCAVVGSVELRSGTTGDPFSDVAIFFCISKDEAHSLFCPNKLLDWAPKPDTYLPFSATREQVAKSIRQFIKWKDVQVAA